MKNTMMSNLFHDNEKIWQYIYGIRDFVRRHESEQLIYGASEKHAKFRSTESYR